MTVSVLNLIVYVAILAALIVGGVWLWEHYRYRSARSGKGTDGPSN